MVKKRCEVQGGGQEMAVMVGYRQKNFNNDNSSEFGARLHPFFTAWLFLIRYYML